ncbi:hypothetical protein [Streptomyces sp. NPDC046925]|uniref:hypothetical protein n=1 Tax=Streptomyces sp. NPDC046925 TaxID=3155375 RepID=UPI0033F9E2FE
MCDCDCELPKRERWEQIRREHAHELATKQKAYFGDVTAQGNDGNWYSVSGWIDPQVNDAEPDPTADGWAARIRAAIEDAEEAGLTVFWVAGRDVRLYVVPPDGDLPDAVLAWPIKERTDD